MGSSDELGKKAFEGLLEIVSTFEVGQRIVLGSSKDSMIHKVEDDVSEVPAFFDVPMVHEGQGHRAESFQGVIFDSFKQFTSRNMALVLTPAFFHGFQGMTRRFAYEIVGAFAEPVVFCMNLMNHVWKVLVAHGGLF